MIKKFFPFIGFILLAGVLTSCSPAEAAVVRVEEGDSGSKKYVNRLKFNNTQVSFDGIEAIIDLSPSDVLAIPAGANVIWVGVGDSIATAFSGASDNDTIMLSSGTHTMTSTLNITKPITIKGMGKGATFINGSTADFKFFNITSDNVTLQDFTIDDDSVSVAIDFDGVNAGDVIHNGKILSVDLSISSSTDTFGFIYDDAGGIIDNVYSLEVLKDANGSQSRAVTKNVYSTAEQDTTLVVSNSFFKRVMLDSQSGTFINRNVMHYNNLDQATTNSYLYVYNSTFIADNSQSPEDAKAEGFHTQGERVYTYLFNCNIFGGGENGYSTNWQGLRVDDDGYMETYNTVINPPNIQNQGAGVIKRKGYLYAQGIVGDSYVSKAADLRAAEKMLDLFGAEGGDDPIQTGTRTGFQGGGLRFTAGTGGLATAGNTQSTGGSGGDFDFLGADGADVTTVTTVTAVGGTGSSFDFTAGNGGDASGGSTASNGGAGGSVYFVGGNGGTGTTANGTDGAVVFGENSGATQSNGKVIFKNLPTSDPTVSGQLWNDSGTLKISAG